MRMKKIFSGIVPLSIFLIQPLFALPPISFSAIENGYRVHLTLQLPQFKTVRVSTTTADGILLNESFVQVKMDGFDYEANVGEPGLPKASFRLAYEGEEPEIRLEKATTEKHAIQGKLFPAQPAACYCEEQGALNGFAYYPEAYERVCGGNMVSIARTCTFRGQKTAIITIEPLVYNPLTGSVTVAREIVFSISAAKPALVRSWNSLEFDRLMRATFVNLDSVSPEPFTGKEKYLIIAMPEYRNSSELNQFIDYRSQTFDVKTVSTADIGGTTLAAYRTFIRNEKPTFCLLVGRAAAFPTWDQSGIGGDWRFSFKSLNYYVATQTTSSSEKPMPDIALGLFYVTSSAQIANIVSKTMQTERGLASRPKMVLGQGGNLDTIENFMPDHCDRTVKEINDRFFKAGDGWTVYSYATTTKADGAQKAVSQFNQGCWFNLYNGHGLTGGQNYGWGTTDLASMTNSVYPFVFTAACFTGTFDQNCVAAAAVCHRYGPVTYIGSYRPSSTGQHVLHLGYIEAIMAKGITRSGMAFVYACNSDSTPRAILEDNGPVLPWRKAMAGWQYHHFGDPAIQTMASNASVATSYGASVGKPFLKINGDNLTIRLSGKSAKEPVAVVVYSMQGRLVKTLVNTRLESGSYSLPLGTGAPGLYLIKLTGHRTRETVQWCKTD